MRAASTRVSVTLLCPSCKQDTLAQRSSFKTDTEPLFDEASKTVIVDLMSCTHCGVDIPTVRGRRSYVLFQRAKLSGLLTELKELRQRNFEMTEQLDGMERRSQRIAAEVERVRAEGEISLVEGRIASLESEMGGLEGRRDKLLSAVNAMASRAPRA